MAGRGHRNRGAEPLAAARGFVSPSWLTVVLQGNLGVRIFFVISGLLITSSEVVPSG